MRRKIFHNLEGFFTEFALMATLTLVSRLLYSWMLFVWLWSITINPKWVGLSSGSFFFYCNWIVLFHWTACESIFLLHLYETICAESVEADSRLFMAIACQNPGMKLIFIKGPWSSVASMIYECKYVPLKNNVLFCERARTRIQVTPLLSNS